MGTIVLVSASNKQMSEDSRKQQIRPDIPLSAERSEGEPNNFDLTESVTRKFASDVTPEPGAVLPRDGSDGLKRPVSDGQKDAPGSKSVLSPAESRAHQNTATENTYLDPGPQRQQIRARQTALATKERSAPQSESPETMQAQGSNEQFRTMRPGSKPVAGTAETVAKVQEAATGDKQQVHNPQDLKAKPQIVREQGAQVSTVAEQRAWQQPKGQEQGARPVAEEITRARTANSGTVAEGNKTVPGDVRGSGNANADIQPVLNEQGQISKPIIPAGQNSAKQLQGAVRQGENVSDLRQYSPAEKGRIPGAQGDFAGGALDKGLPSGSGSQTANLNESSAGDRASVNANQHGSVRGDSSNPPPNTVKGADGKYYVPGQSHNLDGSPVAKPVTIDGVTSKMAQTELSEGSRVKAPEVQDNTAGKIEGTTRPGKLQDIKSEPHKVSTEGEGKVGAKVDVERTPDGHGKRIGLDGREIIGLDGKSSPLYPNHKGKRITRFVDQGKKIVPDRRPGSKTKFDPKAELDPTQRAKIDRIIKETDRIFFGESPAKAKGKTRRGTSGSKGEVRSVENTTKVGKGDLTGKTSTKDTGKTGIGKLLGLPEYAPFPGLKLPEFKIRLPGRKGGDTNTGDRSVRNPSDRRPSEAKANFENNRRSLTNNISKLVFDGQKPVQLERGFNTRPAEVPQGRVAQKHISSSFRPTKVSVGTRANTDATFIPSSVMIQPIDWSGLRGWFETSGILRNTKTRRPGDRRITGKVKGSGVRVEGPGLPVGKAGGDTPTVKTGQKAKAGDTATVKTNDAKSGKKPDKIEAKPKAEKPPSSKQAKNQKFELKESKDAYNGKLPPIKMGYRPDTGKVKSFGNSVKPEQFDAKTDAGKKDVGKQIQKDLRPVNTAKAGIVQPDALTPRTMRELNTGQVPSEIDARSNKTGKAEGETAKVRIEGEKGKFVVEGKDGRFTLRELVLNGTLKGGLSRRVERLMDGARIVDGAHLVSLQIGLHQAKGNSIREVLAGLNLGKAKKGFVPEISESGSYKVTRNQSSIQIKAFGSSARHTAINFSMEPSEELVAATTGSDKGSEDEYDDKESIYRKLNPPKVEPRKPYIVQVGDTVDSIAAVELNDISLGPLIFQINEPLFKEMYDMYKQEHVKTLQTGTMILLPNKPDIEKFKEQKK